MFEYSIIPKSIKTEQFQAFIRKLSEKLGGKPFALFLDNLSVHKTNLSKELFLELQVTPIFNIPYSPQFNGIESYFSLLKHEYKKMILEQVMKGDPVDAVTLIKASIEKVDDKKTIKCVKYGFECINE